jgi:hypothetical protein
MHRLLAVALAVAPAEPDLDERVRPLIREGDFVGVAQEYAREYDRTGDPALLFGQAQALRRAGDCKSAIEVFERYVETDPPDADEAAANEAMAACREIVEAAEPPPPEPTPPEPEPEPARAPEPAPRRWYEDPAGGALVGIGGVLAVTGAGLFGGAYARPGEQAESEAALEERTRVTRALWGSGLALLVTGGVAIVAGAIRWGVVARKHQRIDASAGGITVRF